MRGEEPIWIVIPVWCIGAATVLGSLVVLSRLVRIERERHPAAWEADGRPAAPWETPWRLPRRGDPAWGTQAQVMRTNRPLYAWLFRTPAWARDDAEARRLLRVLRALQTAGLVVLVAWCAIFALHRRSG